MTALRSRLVSGAKNLSVFYKKNRWISTLCLAHFLLSVLIGSQFPLVRDAANYAIYADYVLKTGSIPLFHPELHWVRPVVPVGAAVSKAVIGIYPGGVALMGSLSIFLTFRLVRIFDDERTARLSALAMFCNPFLLLWSGQLLVGTTVLTGFLSVFYFYFDYQRTGSRQNLYLAFIIGGLLSLVKIYGPLALVVVGLHSLVVQVGEEMDFKEWFKTYLGPGIVGGVLSVSWVAKNYTYTGQLLPKVFGRGGSGGQFLQFNSVVPSTAEVFYFATQALGVTPPNLIIEDVGELHPALPLVWILLPLGLCYCVVQGARQYRTDTFVRLWAGSIVAVFLLLQALGHNANWLYRHFIVLTPLVSLFLATYYDQLEIDDSVKQAGIVILVVVLMSQMVFAGVLFQQHVRVGYEPVTEWTNENVETEEDIYTTRFRELSYRLPDHSFVKNRSNATVVILNDADSTTEKRRSFQNKKCVTLLNNLDSRRQVEIRGLDIGTLGREWWVYRRSC